MLRLDFHVWSSKLKLIRQFTSHIWTVYMAIDPNGWDCLFLLFWWMPPLQCNKPMICAVWIAVKKHERVRATQSVKGPVQTRTTTHQRTKVPLPEAIALPPTEIACIHALFNPNSQVHFRHFHFHNFSSFQFMTPERSLWLWIGEILVLGWKEVASLH